MDNIVILIELSLVLIGTFMIHEDSLPKQKTIGVALIIISQLVFMSYLKYGPF